MNECLFLPTISHRHQYLHLRMAEILRDPQKQCCLLKACADALRDCTLCAAKSKESGIECCDVNSSSSLSLSLFLFLSFSLFFYMILINDGRKQNCVACASMLQTALTFTAMNLPHTDEVLKLSANLAAECSDLCGSHKESHCKGCSDSCGKWVKAVRDLQL